MRAENPLSRLYNQEALAQQGIQREHIPLELQMITQWVCWRYVDRGQGKKPEKQPVNPRTLHRAGVHWPNTWTDFGTAYTTYRTYRTRGIQGMGFVLTPDDPYVAVDLDACIEEYTIDEHATKIIATLGSYTEVSPSGQGIRILVSCVNFWDNQRHPRCELYAQARYVTITGHHVAGTPQQIMPVTLDTLTSIVPQPAPEPVRSPASPSQPKYYAVPDLELWERIFTHDKYGNQHLRRFQGDTSIDRGDHSLTVIRLLNCLARWTKGDAARIRTMMLLSPLANNKWFEKRGDGDWLDYQIANAIAYVSSRQGT